MAKGFLVAFEAPSGAGKSTHSKAVNNILSQEVSALWASVANVPLGPIIKQTERSTKGLAFAHLVAAGTQQLLDDVVGPALIAGKVVILNRYIGSSLALLQVDGVKMNLVWRINKMFPPPDLIVSLTAPPKILQQRLQERKKFTRFSEKISRKEEIAIFRQAMNFMRNKGIEVLEFNTDCEDSSILSHEIASQVLKRFKR